MELRNLLSNRSWIEKFKFYYSTLFFAALILLSIGFLSYKSIIKGSSKELYTIATIVGVYSTSKDYGRTYEYVVSGVTYRGQCTTDDCAKLGIGRRYIVRFWSKRHNWSDLLTNKPVVTDIVPPKEGWQTLPIF